MEANFQNNDALSKATIFSTVNSKVSQTVQININKILQLYILQTKLPREELVK